MDENQTKPAKSLSIPVAIILAGVLIAGAVFLNKSPGTEVAPAAKGADTTIAPPAVPKVTARDHLLGSPNAELVIIEYSDLECPFCKTFHQTLHRLMDEYGKTSQLAWVYRHFPLTELHPKAPKEAEASECAAELGGNTAFWNFIDQVFATTPSNNGLDPAFLPKIAKQIGLDESAFSTCLASGKYTTKVKAGHDEAVSLGAQGTPQSFIIAGKEVVPVEGAQPYAAVKAVIENLLAQKSGSGKAAVPVITP